MTEYIFSLPISESELECTQNKVMCVFLGFNTMRIFRVSWPKGKGLPVEVECHSAADIYFRMLKHKLLGQISVE